MNLPRYLGLALTVTVLACSDDSSTPAPGPSTSPDSGFMGLPDAPDMGITEVVDAGPTDAGPTTCDPVTGAGCPGDRSCVWMPEPDEPQCRDIGEANALGESCSRLLTDCAPGGVCLQFQGEAEGSCRQTCRPANFDADCASVPGNSRCVALMATSGEFGFCQTFEACDPLMDTCPPGEACGIIAVGAVGCQPAGTVPAGASCQTQSCVRGAVCVNLGGQGGQCFQPCDDDAVNPGCAGNFRCASLAAFDFGICVPATAACDPVADMCPQGDRCTLVGQGAAECRPAGNVMRGADCSMMSCQRGNVCVNVNNGGARCYQPCRDGQVTCAMGSCSQNLTGFDFGLCL